MSYDPTFVETMETTTRLIKERVPGIGDILDDAVTRGRPLDEVLLEVMSLVRASPEVAVQVEEIVEETFAPLRVDDVVLPPRGPGEHKRLNPMYSATLQERLHLDGDAPELRSGPLPRGTLPAVPVATDARDAVTLGWMLTQASEQVAHEAQAIEARREALLTDANTAALSPTSAMAVQALMNRDTLADPEGYERGQLPARRDVSSPDTTTMTSLTPEQRGQLAWKFLSTSQGRRSATTTILRLMEAGLRGDGFDVVARDGTPGRVDPAEVVAYAEWAVSLGGPGTTQPGFAFVDTAARVLAHKLEEATPKHVPLLLEVVTVDTVDVRQVGWAARLTRRAS